MHKVGSLISYWILLASDIPVSIKTVQHVTYIKTFTDATNQRFEVYNKVIKERLHNDEDFQSDINKVFDNPSAKQSDKEFTPDFYNYYVNMELTLD